MLESTVAHIKNLTYIYIYIWVCVSLDLSKKLSKTLVAATRPSNVLGSLRRIRSERLPSLFSHLCLCETATVR